MAEKPLSYLLRGVTRFGRLAVVDDAAPKVSPRGYSARCAKVRCDCGVEKVVRVGDLKNGYTTSCGCLHRELLGEFSRQTRTTHGNANKDRRTAEYITWSGMKDRCHNPNSDHFDGYGARGIEVCAAWRDSFESFLADVGPKPSPAHSIDRIDNDGNYEPTNVRWATAKQQANNRRRSTKL